MCTCNNTTAPQQGNLFYSSAKDGGGYVGDVQTGDISLFDGWFAGGDTDNSISLTYGDIGGGSSGIGLYLVVGVLAVVMIGIFAFILLRRPAQIIAA